MEQAGFAEAATTVTGSSAGSLADLFDIEPAETPDVFVAHVPPTDGGRAFGGHLMGLAVRAAAATVPPAWAPAPPHALHARFVRPGAAGDRVRLVVDRVRDGRTTCVRRVLVNDPTGRTLVTTEVCFRPVVEDATDWWSVVGPPVLPATSIDNPMATALPLAPFDIRAVHGYTRGGPVRLHPYWARLRTSPCADPVLDACALAVLTDIGVTGSAREPGSPLRVQRQAVTLGHALWVHRRIPWESWLCVDAVAESNAGGLGFARGSVRLPDGTPVASFGQEVLLEAA